MVGRVTRGRDRAQDESVPELDLVAGRDGSMRDLQMRALRREEHGPSCGELGAARHVVGMRVRVGGERDLEAARASLGDVLVGNPGRIDDERPAVAEIDEVRRMTEALVDERHDLGHQSTGVIARDAAHEATLRLRPC